MKFSNSEQKTNLEAIQKLESFFGYDLPKEYVIHLLKYNGGQCEPNIFYFKERGKLTNSDIDWFLALYDGECDNLFNYLADYKDKIPNHFIPVAHDSGGNLICLSCGKNDFGYVYFWDHEYDKTGANNYFIIAKSFNQFIESIK